MLAAVSGLLGGGGGIKRFARGDKSFGVGPGPNCTGPEMRRDGL